MLNLIQFLAVEDENMNLLKFEKKNPYSNSDEEQNRKKIEHRKQTVKKVYSLYAARDEKYQPNESA